MPSQTPCDASSLLSCGAYSFTPNSSVACSREIETIESYRIAIFSGSLYIYAMYYIAVNFVTWQLNYVVLVKSKGFNSIAAHPTNPTCTHTTRSERNQNSHSERTIAENENHSKAQLVLQKFYPEIVDRFEDQSKHKASPNGDERSDLSGDLCHRTAVKRWISLGFGTGCWVNFLAKARSTPPRKSRFQWFWSPKIWTSHLTESHRVPLKKKKTQHSSCCCFCWHLSRSGWCPWLLHIWHPGERKYQRWQSPPRIFSNGNRGS